MSKRYEHLHYCEYRDTETGLIASNYVDVMNEQDQKIKDLEHRLSNSIEPKFKVGQEVWYIKPSFLNPEKSNIDYIIIYENTKFYALTNGFEYRDDMVFATEEEAKKHLEELKNG